MKIASAARTGDDLQLRRRALRMVLRRGVQRVVPFRESKFIFPAVTQHPGVRLARLLDHDERLFDGAAVAPSHDTANFARGEMPAFDFGVHDRLQIGVRPDLQHAVERVAFAGCERVQPEEVPRARANMVEVRGVQRHHPVLIIGNDAIGQRAIRRALLDARQPRYAKEIAPLGPQREPR